MIEVVALAIAVGLSRDEFELWWANHISSPYPNTVWQAWAAAESMRAYKGRADAAG